MRYRRTVAFLLGLGLLASACSVSASSDSGSCSTAEVSAQLKSRYSLGDLPQVSSFRFCEKEDKDGFAANMYFVAKPDDGVAYLESLGMRWKDFVRASPRDVTRLSQAEGEGWRLRDGENYLTSSRSREWNGECLVDYRAFVPEGKSWKGEVFIGVYCEE